ncbi:MAG: MATE family efflux transporter [Lachnospiraceae bacterium]|nr:MATE family efflux transporter [Lachnospiraceae bacterium]
MNEEKMSMTEGTVWKILVRFAFPLLLGNLFQQLYNAVDSLVVGNFCGNEALAAVSSSGSLQHLLIGFFQGVFIGASVLISRCFGAKDKEGVDEAIHTTVVFALVAGVVLTILGVAFTPTVLRWMGTPENVMPNSVTYFRIYCMGLLGMVLYNTTNGIFNALGDSRHPLYYLIISSVTNAVLDLIFVGVFHWGVAGAALATTMGQFLSAILGLMHLMSGRFIVQIKVSKLHVNPNVLKQVFMLGLPSGVQNSVNAIANLVVQSNINAFGDLAMAGCGSYAKVQGFVFLPIMSMALALTTFVGQNMGANRPDRVKKGIRQGMMISVVMAEIFGVFVFMFASQLVGLFSKDPAVVAFGVQQARVEALFFFLLATTHACAGILRGAGKTMIPMAVTLGAWCVLRIVYIEGLVRIIPNINVVFSAYPVTWVTSSLLLLWFVKRQNWDENTQKVAGEL